jgi:hypothetical protein
MQGNRSLEGDDVRPNDIYIDLNVEIPDEPHISFKLAALQTLAFGGVMQPSGSGGGGPIIIQMKADAGR